LFLRKEHCRLLPVGTNVYKTVNKMMSTDFVEDKLGCLLYL